MQFIHSELGHRKRGDIIEVSLTAAANVRLMDTANFTNYKNSQQHRYHGGLAKQTPVRIMIPCTGHWHLVVDMQGLTGTTKVSLKVIAGQLPDIPNLTPANGTPYGDVPVAPPRLDASGSYHDLVLWHTFDARGEIARPLANLLFGQGLSASFEDHALAGGESIGARIAESLLHCRVILLIITPEFIYKGWPPYEIEQFVRRLNHPEQNMIIVTHKLLKRELLEFCPAMGPHLHFTTANYTLEELAQALAEHLHSIPGRQAVENEAVDDEWF